jgi:carbamoylphosphate synthase large subunit
MEHKKILVCGAGGFIGTHLVNSLKLKGHYVVGVDLKRPDFSPTTADEFYVYDLRDRTLVNAVISKHRYDEIYQLAADMGGAGFISFALAFQGAFYQMFAGTTEPEVIIDLQDKETGCSKTHCTEGCLLLILSRNLSNPNQSQFVQYLMTLSLVLPLLKM